MKIKTTTWISFFALSAISILIWFKYSYPQLSFSNLSVTRQQALSIAYSYMSNNNYDMSDFKKAIILQREAGGNQYLQKVLGFNEFKSFIEDNDYDLFFWLIRFFKEGSPEEFRVTISSATGQVIGFNHSIKETDARPIISREEAYKKAVEFMTNTFNLNIAENYVVQGEISNQYDNRTDHAFTWRKKDISIPWSEKENSGTGKLYTGITVSGDEILYFYKHSFSVPQDFRRDIAVKQEISRNIGTVTNILYVVLFVAAIFFIILRKNHLAMHTTKHFYFSIMGMFFVLLIASEFNDFEGLLFGYNTTSPFNAFFTRDTIFMIKAAIFASVAVVIPSFAGEVLHYEVRRNNREGSFLYYVRSTFLSRSVSQQILLGYLVCTILLGMQAFITQLGRSYWDVWVEHNFITDLSTAYIPVLTAFSLGFKASFIEELKFRLFAINFFQKIFKNIFVAAIISSLIWGFAHTSYPVFPMWFRGIEVSLIGFFLSFIYLKFGIITVIVAHYLFDVFWGCAGYILGKSHIEYFLSAFSVLIFPLIFSVIAWVLNRQVDERKMAWKLNKHQKFNLNLLTFYIKQHPEEFQGKDHETIKKEISKHGWDIAVVEVALEETLNSNKKSDA